MFRNSIIRHSSGLFLLFCILLISCLPGCSKPKAKPQVQSTPQTEPQKLYLKSQQELARENYKQAYSDYRKAVSMDQGVANASHLSSILYSWVISKSEPEDIPLLNGQKKVWLAPHQLALREGLLSVGVDKDKRIIHAFGLGFAPENIKNPAQRSMLARKTAEADAAAWVARLATWAEAGVSCPFDISSQTLVGMETSKELWVDDTVYVVKVQAPVDCLK